jgi:polyhydroxyalkanoate synthesis regulator phasin
LPKYQYRLKKVKLIEPAPSDTSGIPMDNNNLLNQLLMFGIGTTSMVAEKLRDATDQLVKDGKLDPEQAAKLANDLMQQVKSEQGNWEAQMQRQVRNIMQDLGVPRQNEMDELRGRLDRLERQVRDLENKLWR